MSLLIKFILREKHDTRVYKGVQGYTRVYKGVQWYTRVYKGVQGYTRVYKRVSLLRAAELLSANYFQKHYVAPFFSFRRTVQTVIL